MSVTKRYHQFFLLLCFITATLFSQERPFPQDFKYAYGYMPTTFKTSNLESWYKSYKQQNNLLIECNGGIRTGCEENGVTKVESMGWAMIIAAYMADKSDFDGLYKFYKDKRQGHGMMAWKTNCNGVVDGGSASDGDLDVAFSLVVATWQWGDEYRSAAEKEINTVKKLITNCSGTSVLYGGFGGNSGYGGCNQTDISYYTPAFFRYFAEFTDDDGWIKLADDTYTVLDNAANDNTGLVPNWHTLAGGQSSMGQFYYGFDACRVPWRIALDYLWNGNEKAKAWCTKISNWANKIGPNKIVDGYNLDGSSTGRYHNMSYVGGFAVAAMCNSQEVADAFGSEIASMRFDSYWYHAFLGTCYMLAMTGNMWNSDMTATSSTPRANIAKPAAAETVRMLSTRNLAVSGLSRGSTVTLTSLSGQLVQRSANVPGTEAVMNLSSVKNGCYLVSITGGNGSLLRSEVVSVY